MDQGFCACSDYLFCGVEYRVTFQSLIRKANQCLSVEVEDKLTGDQWKGLFESNYIEDLTRKTGNFKQFDVFLSMLESALDKTTESVTLDLLTFADLESLRNRKAGAGSYATRSKPASRQQENKRYLILVYSVEFDRIHYPLPLMHQGKPDPSYLQNLVQDLNNEISRLKCERNDVSRDSEFIRLREDYAALLREKKALEQLVIELKSDIQSGSKHAITKEVRVLKKVVENLEMDMMKEKNRFQRSTSKKSAEIKRLNNELHEVTARERTLHIRVKSLTNELAMYKRRTPTPSGNRDVISRGSSSRPHRPGSSLRPGSRGSQSGSFYQNRSASRDRPASRDRSLSREKHSYLQRSGHKSRTPTPNRLSRFNPTLYNEERKRKLKESQERLKRRSSFGQVRGSSNGRGRSRTRAGRAVTSSTSRNRNASLESRNSSDNGSITRKMQIAWTDSPNPRSNHLSSTPDAYRDKFIHKRRNVVSNDPDIDEIDARLEALQQYMQEIEKK